MTANVAVVTGGSRGIGEAVVRRLTDIGHAVLFTYTSDDSGVDQVRAFAADAGRNVLALRCDITDVDAPQRILDAAEELGEVIVLVNNAGISGPVGPLRTATDATLTRVIDVNLTGTLRLCREVSARWEARNPRPDRSIVNVTSIAARTGAPGEYVWYAASKAGVEALTVGLAKELAGQGIRVNAVSPGTTATTIHARAGRPDRAAQVGARTPLGRAASPDEIAAAVVWLTTADAGYITGAVLDVTGGVR